MRKLKEKLGKNGGFTLVEMLIVVAIIAILIAISIPLISSSLEKARHSVDDANKRDAESLATVWYLSLSQTEMSAKFSNASATVTLEYYINDHQQGRLYESGDTKEGTPAKVTCTHTSDASCTNRPEKDKPLTVTINGAGEIQSTSFDLTTG